MKCPICIETNLVMTERQGVEIDYCPQCRGVWLDRGELDKIIERSQAQQGQPAYQPQAAPNHHGNEHWERHDDHGKHGHHQRRRSWLGELFD